MQRNTILAWAAVSALVMAGCADGPQTMLSPTAADADATALNPDGSALKASAPTELSPREATVDSLRPTLSFNAATGRFVSVAFASEIEVVNANGDIVYTRMLGESSGRVSHGLESDLTYADNFWFRARARLGTDVGPWSEWAGFRTLDRPGPAAPTGGGGRLPFPVPEACRFGGFACVSAVAALSVEWQGCARGSGVSCHRFTRQVAHALASFDPNWANIQAGPGGHSCNCSGCGPSDGSMFREDTVVYAGREVFDMILGAGGPTPSLSWGSTPGPRTGDIPVLAPLCAP
jgi:hypothetical protein